MKKKIIIICIIVLAFICTNMVTFALARGKTKITKMTGVTEKPILNEAGLLLNAGKEEKMNYDNAARKLKSFDQEQTNYNDESSTGYFSSDSPLEGAENIDVNPAQESKKEDNSNMTQEASQSVGGTFNNVAEEETISGASQNANYSEYDNQSGEDSEDLTMQLPQFPLTDSDFEVQSDENSLTDIALPEMPSPTSAN
ncbi:MAG: hypothetical protein COS99_00920 [Candidatus Omnitrophica bacterium CG07_land_8_20_14_0_80_42_15]|uniref:Uncharacterized protein n=1 Tax=Candidatus Aquitaenariimonas noxiae TaxID=1974741 RepID=A0A2J0KV02_9BACT|nr:MAG: hypothetical protein COS99_00920 [Candidatus Omnitrophica bacterium CG07_land_8_20_14_0_80_42_15]